MEVVTRKQAKERGLKKYFTGKPCKWGHVCERETVWGTCQECMKIKSLTQSIISEGIMRKKDVNSLREKCKNLGLKTYFTGNPCKHGHVAERYTSNNHCIACEVQVHLIMTPERFCLYKKRRATRQTNKRANSPDEVKKQDRINYQKYKERIILQNKKYYEQNRERYIKNAKKWRMNNHDKFIVNAKTSFHNRRARKRQSAESFTAKQIRNMLICQKQKCAFCYCSIKYGYHVDHIFPLSKGGSNGIKNIQLLCRPCNLRKSNKDPIKFAWDHGKLL